MKKLKNQYKKELESFAENIAELRYECGLSVKEMAELLNISKYRLRKLEKGRLAKKSGLDISLRIYKIFKIDLENQFNKLYNNIQP